MALFLPMGLLVLSFALMVLITRQRRQRLS
jgi:hypothetical protein